MRQLSITSLTEKANKYKWTIIGCLLSGGISHGFALVNILQNYDNIYINPIGYGTGIQSGRWLLSVLGNIVELLDFGHNLPVINGIFTIFLLTVTVVIIADLFHLQDKYGFLFGTIFLSFPTLTATFLFMYTVHYYALSAMFAVITVRLTEKGGCRNIILAIGFEAASLGIYQAYIPMTATLFVLLLILKAFEYKSRLKEIVTRAFYYLSVLAGGFILYFFCLWGLLTITDTQLTTYVNIDKMGKINFSDIPDILTKCYSAFYLPFKNYNGVALTETLKVCITVIELLVLGLLFYSWLKQYLRTSNFIISILLYCIVYPIALNSIELICFNSRIYILMIYSVVFLFLLPLILLNALEYHFFSQNTETGIRHIRWIKIFRSVAIFTTIVVAVNYIYLANVNYTAVYYMNQGTTNYLNRFIMRVQSTKGYDVSYKWALIGDTFQDPSFTSPWDSNLIYSPGSGNIINTYSRSDYIKKYLGFSFHTVESNKLEELKQISAVRNMPCYPNEGSIIILKDVIVIKLCNE